MDLRRFCLSHPGALSIPAEHLGDEGLSREVRALFRAEASLSEEALSLFDRGFRLYRERAAELHARAPGSWLPPRKANVVVVTDPDRVRPYSAPFLRSSWCLYASDLDPERSHEEYVAYQIFHVERLSFLGAVRAAVCFNLSYFLVRTEDELHAFSRAASRASRPDARAFVALARALPWIRELHHVPLREPSMEAAAELGHVEGADLLMPKRVRPDMLALFGVFDAAAREMTEHYLGRQAEARPGRDPAGEVCDFLRAERPDVVLASGAENIVYRPEAGDDVSAARAALAQVTARAAESLREDLRVVSRKSRVVLASLRDRARLPRSSEVLEADGGVYVRPDLGAIVYDLRQPGFEPLREEAPPHHRALLGARVAHEWGHLVHEAGIVRVPEARRAEYDEALRELERRYARIVGAIPSRLDDEVREELTALGASPGAPGPALARFTLERIGDYASNLFFRRYLEDDELQAYVRTNLRHHLTEGIGPLGQLTRHVVEFQYLGLASFEDPFAYFVETTYFGHYFLATGVFAEADVRALFDAASRLCACFELDESALAGAAEGESANESSL
jgi:hypothetical protein